jgi:hypothetical protein
MFSSKRKKFNFSTLFHEIFSEKRHHEVEIWPDSVVVGKEPENEPKPTEYIKASRETN